MKLSHVLLCGLLCVSATSTFASSGAIFKTRVGPAISLQRLGTYESGLIDESAAEIIAYDAKSQRVLVTNANDQSVDVISIRFPRFPRRLFSIDLSPYGAPNSVAVSNGVIAVAAEASEVGVRGQVVFFNRNGKFLNALEVGFLPDMVTFSPDGNTLLVANEGEPNDDYTLDPEGSISVIAIEGRISGLTQSSVKTADFSAFSDASLLDESVRIFGPNASVAQDLEPEYIAVSADSSTAYVALQENNAFAVVDLASAQVTDIIGLGSKSFNTIQTAIDASDRDGGVNITPRPVRGFYQPDTIASYDVEGQTYIVSANEGDSRDYAGFSEEVRVDDLILDPALLDAYPNLQDDEELGRLRTTTEDGDIDGDGDVDQIFAYGARSFSIWNATTGAIVFDSGSDFARITAATSVELFNAGDRRSDDRGAEPEALTLGKVGHRTYAFIGLERTGGIMVYDITSPLSPYFVEYINNTNLDGDVDAGTADDVAPEGLVFISAKDSPNRRPLLVVANEVSGTTTVYQVNQPARQRQHRFFSRY